VDAITENNLIGYASDSKHILSFQPLSLSHARIITKI